MNVNEIHLNDYELHLKSSHLFWPNSDAIIVRQPTGVIEAMTTAAKRKRVSKLSSKTWAPKHADQRGFHLSTFEIGFVKHLGFTKQPPHPALHNLCFEQKWLLRQRITCYAIKEAFTKVGWDWKFRNLHTKMVGGEVVRKYDPRESHIYTQQKRNTPRRTYQLSGDRKWCTSFVYQVRYVARFSSTTKFTNCY